jgi:hypothetical protein
MHYNRGTEMNTFPFIVVAVGNIHEPDGIRWTVQKPSGKLDICKWKSQRRAARVAKLLKLGKLS